MSDERKFYSEREKMLLLNLVENYRDIIENKRTDGITIRKKQETWEKITRTFNANDVGKRSAKQLKKLWDNIKQKVRRNESEKKSYVLKTGGGPPPQEDNDPLSERVRAIVPTIDYEVENKFDSIAIFTNENEKGNINNTSENIPGPSSQEMNEHDLLPRDLPVLGEHNYNLDRVLDSQKDALQLSNAMDRQKKMKNPSASLILSAEAALRKEKLEESIMQQREIHQAKMEAAAAEREYWETRTNLLRKNNPI